VHTRFPQIGTHHAPPADIGANFYPSLGPYSSGNATIIRAHVGMMARAGIGILVYSWWGRPSHSKGDANGPPPDEKVVADVLDACEALGVRLAFHLEPYEGRSEMTVKADLEYLAQLYSKHPALYRQPAKQGLGRPLAFVYDSYQTKPEKWSRVFSPGGDISVRGGAADFLVLGLWVERQHGQDLLKGGFDGFYTYFATNGMTWGSSHSNWGQMAAFAKKNAMLFVPSAGPGYTITPNHQP
ncbi:hypothetical protein T484DRAFT_1630430, partial [Baffinella frigidus]